MHLAERGQCDPEVGMLIVDVYCNTQVTMVIPTGTYTIKCDRINEMIGIFISLFDN